MQGCCGVLHNILDLRLHFLWTNVCFGSKGKGKLRRKWKEKEEEEGRKSRQEENKKMRKLSQGDGVQQMLTYMYVNLFNF